MPELKQTKALFRCLFAYSNGQPVKIFDVDGNCASLNRGIALTVAVAGAEFDEFEVSEWMERLASAYDLFVDDPEASAEQLRWVKPEVLRGSNR